MPRIIEQTKKLLAVTAIACSAALMPTYSSDGAPVRAADAAAAYKSKCASCHGANGSGQTASGKSMKLKDLRSPEVQGLSDAQLNEIIAKGKAKMPGYEKSLGADTCKALVTYIRQLK
jgi:mono/diheme cytochrome c family protein